MSTDNDDTPGAAVAFAVGALIGIAATLFFVRSQRNRLAGAQPKYDDYDYYYDGGDLFI